MRIRFDFILVLLLFLNFKTYSDEFMMQSSGFYLTLYQNYISPIRSNYSKCGFYPSCSQYTRQACRDYGFIKGIMMTGDRLMRCHPGLAISRYWGWKNDYIYDPPQFEWEVKTNIWIKSNDTNKVLHEIQPLLIQYPWIKKIIADGEFELGIMKLKEIIYFDSADSLELSMINYLLGWLNTRMDHLDLAISYYRNGAYAFYMSRLAESSFRRLAEIYLHDLNLQQLQVEINKLEKINNHSLNDELSRWKYLCYMGAGDFDNGSKLLNNQSTFNHPEKIAELVTELKQGAPGSLLFTGMSGAAMPGSGYLIAGEKKDALYAFLTNFLLIGGTVELIRNKSYLGATFLGMFTLPFYLGSIYGGINAIKLKQANWKQQKLFELKFLLEL